MKKFEKKSAGPLERLRLRSGIYASAVTVLVVVLAVLLNLIVRAVPTKYTEFDRGASAGFGCLAAVSRSSYASANLGFRLCQETEEKAKYFGQQFIELWAEYLKFNFTVGNRLK